MDNETRVVVQVRLDAGGSELVGLVCTQIHLKRLDVADQDLNSVLVSLFSTAVTLMIHPLHTRKSLSHRVWIMTAGCVQNQEDNAVFAVCAGLFAGPEMSPCPHITIHTHLQYMFFVLRCSH